MSLVARFSAAGWGGKRVLWVRASPQQRQTLFLAASFVLRKSLLGWLPADLKDEYKFLRSLQKAPIHVSRSPSPPPSRAGSSAFNFSSSARLPRRSPSSPASPASPACSSSGDPEPVSHNRLEGARIGEAENPGPPWQSRRRQTANSPVCMYNSHPGCSRGPPASAPRQGPTSQAPPQRSRKWGPNYVPKTSTRDAEGRRPGAPRGPDVQSFAPSPFPSRYSPSQ